MVDMNISEQEAQALKEMLAAKANELKAKEEMNKASTEIVEFAKVEPAVKQLVDLGYDKTVLSKYPELAVLASDPARFRQVFLSRAKEMLELEKKSAAPAPAPVQTQTQVIADKAVPPIPTQSSGAPTDDTVLNPNDPKFVEYLKAAGADKNKTLLWKMFNNLGTRNEQLRGG